MDNQKFIGSLSALWAYLKAELPGDLYRQMIIYHRARHNGTESEHWQGKAEFDPAVTRYPNILAELDASGYWMGRLVDYAEVSPAVMASVMEDNKELSLYEMDRLCLCFGCKFDYLASPVLSIVDPSTSKGRVRLAHLKDLLEQTEGMDRFMYDNSENVLPDLESGKPVTYAAYRWACSRLQFVLDLKTQQEAKQKRIRTGELSFASSAGQVSLKDRIQRARAWDKERKQAARLSAIRMYVDSTEIQGGENATTGDLLCLATFSNHDLTGSLSLAISYGRALGYQAAMAKATN